MGDFGIFLVALFGCLALWRFSSLLAIRLKAEKLELAVAEAEAREAAKLAAYEAVVAKDEYNPVLFPSQSHDRDVQAILAALRGPAVGDDRVES